MLTNLFPESEYNPSKENKPMPVKQPRYAKEEVARRARDIYDRFIRSKVEPAHDGEIVAIDLDTGEWEVDPDDEAAFKRLDARLPDSQILTVRVGFLPVHKFRSC